MKKTGICPKCESCDIITDARAVDRDDGFNREMIVTTYRNPNALIFKDTQVTVLSAWVCANCGFTEFYADDPSNIVRPGQ